MAKSLDARLTQMERELQRRRAAEVRRIAQEFGLTVEALLQEAEQFLSQPLEAQLAQVDEIAAEMAANSEPWPELDAIKATLMREYRPCE
jgi:hypothetical protein